MAEKAARIAALAKDISEYLAELGLREPAAETWQGGLSLRLLDAARQKIKTRADDRC